MRPSIARLVARGATLLAVPAAVGIAGLAAIPLACGNLGEPAFAGPDGTVPMEYDTTPPAEDAHEDAGPALVPIHGEVEGPDGGPLVALIAIELGGFDQEPPGAAGDGGVMPTLQIDTLYAYGTLTTDAGDFSLDVPDEKIGVHVYATGYSCGQPDAGTVVPGKGPIVLSPRPLSPVDAGDGAAQPERPTVTGLTVRLRQSSPPTEVVAPGTSVIMSAEVKAPDPGDPLSEQVIAIEPTTGWAGAFAPPKPGTWGKGYPNGVYSRLVTVPSEAGEYTYYLIAATEACVVSDPVTAHVIVSLTDSGLPDGTSD